LGEWGHLILAAAPRIVPPERRALVNPLVIGQDHGQAEYRCFQKMPDQWGMRALPRGVCIRCMGTRGFEYQLCSCLAEPRTPRVGPK
jgi:hypothetical protein